MDLLQAPQKKHWAKVSFHTNLAAGRAGGPVHQFPSGCCGSHLQATGANLVFYSEILSAAGLRDERTGGICCTCVSMPHWKSLVGQWSY